MMPFNVDPEWYEKYWYAPVKRRSRTRQILASVHARRVMLSVAAAGGQAIATMGRASAGLARPFLRRGAVR